MSDFKLLVIEDDEDIREVIVLHLERAGYSVDWIDNGSDAIDLVQKKNYDLFVVDRMIPGANGIEVCKYIRSNNSTKLTPILFVTALAASEDIVDGLNAGGDDYLTKPFDLKVLSARVLSLLRRWEQVKQMQHEDPANSIEVGGIVMDQEKHLVQVDGREIHLTLTEGKILQELLKHAGKVMSRDKLVKSVIGDSIHVTERTIDTHIAALRKKLGQKSSIIETIRGVGYRVND